MIRLVRLTGVVVLTLLSSVFALVPVAAAATPSPVPTFAIDIKCDGSNVITFTPPLTLVNQPTTVNRTTKYNPCSSPTAPAVTSGLESRTFTLGDDCTMVLASGTVNFTITWNTGQTTTFTANRTASISGTTLTVTFTGTVTAGLFAGSSVRQVFTGSAVDLINCLNGTGRLSSLTSSVSLIIYH